MQIQWFHWIAFNLIIIIFLARDLRTFYKQKTPPTFKQSILATFFWMSLAFVFNAWVYFFLGKQAGLNFLTAYLLEESLSIDNLFVFLIIFKHLNIPHSKRHRILFFGVLGAIILRALFILAGVTLIHYFVWSFYIFGLFLIYTGLKLTLSSSRESQSPETSPIYHWLTKKLNIRTDYTGSAFFIKENHQWIATPLFLALILIEFTDVIFAVDSIPAVLGVTTDPFIVYTSNICAVLGLRSLFFVLEGFMNRFYLLHHALGLILTFIGIKMLIKDFIEIPTLVTFGLLIFFIGSAIIGSILFPSSKENKIN